MQRRVLLAAALMLILAAWFAAEGAPAQVRSTDVDSGAASQKLFTDDVLVISSRSDSSVGAVLQHVEIKRIGGREFLVGTGVDYDVQGNWHKGRMVWVAVEDISQIVEFPDVEAYKKAGEDLEGVL